MTRPFDTELHIKRWKILLDYQKKISPFIPTVRELMDLWGLNTTSATRRTLIFLLEKGLVIHRGEKKSAAYYAIENKDYL
jgi:hypothetical protein